jgi:hypothetical protein
MLNIILYTFQEFDHAHVLLQNKNGFLFNMVQQTGKGMIEILTKKAKMVRTGEIFKKNMQIFHHGIFIRSIMINAFFGAH